MNKHITIMTLGFLFMVSVFHIPSDVTATGPEDYDVFNIGVEVLDTGGAPLQGVSVKAVSDDWG